MNEIDVLRKEICDALIQLRTKNPQADVFEGMLINAYLTLEEHEEIEKKLARIKVLEAQQ